MAYVGTARYLIDDRTTLASVLQGEAKGGQPQIAVGNVMLNRAEINFGGYGTSPVDQALGRLQFQGQVPVNQITAQSYATADQMLDGSLPRTLPNSLNYAAPVFTGPGATTAPWALSALRSGEGVNIGGNVFFRNDKGGTPDYNPDAGPGGGSQSRVPETGFGANSQGSSFDPNGRETYAPAETGFGENSSSLSTGQRGFFGVDNAGSAGGGIGSATRDDFGGYNEITAGRGVTLPGGGRNASVVDSLDGQEGGRSLYGQDGQSRQYGGFGAPGGTFGAPGEYGGSGGSGFTGASPETGTQGVPNQGAVYGTTSDGSLYLRVNPETGGAPAGDTPAQTSQAAPQQDAPTNQYDTSTNGYGDPGDGNIIGVTIGGLTFSTSTVPAAIKAETAEIKKQGTAATKAITEGDKKITDGVTTAGRTIGKAIDSAIGDKLTKNLGSISKSWQDYFSDTFLRVAFIVVGLVVFAAGLWYFARPGVASGVVNDATRFVRKTARKAVPI